MSWLTSDNPSGKHHSTLAIALGMTAGAVTGEHVMRIAPTLAGPLESLNTVLIGAAIGLIGRFVPGGFGEGLCVIGWGRAAVGTANAILQKANTSLPTSFSNQIAPAVIRFNQVAAPLFGAWHRYE